MTYPEYLAYLRSPHWTARKQAVIRYRGEHCERCWSTDKLELHHRTYKRLGHELPEDVVLLCRSCHERAHGFQPNRRHTPTIDSPILERMRLIRELAAWLAFLQA